MICTATKGERDWEEGAEAIGGGGAVEEREWGGGGRRERWEVGGDLSSII